MELQKTVSMRGTSSRGFSLLELMIAILLMGLMATLIVPNLQDWIPGYRQKAFISELSSLINLTWQNALTTQKMHRISFDFKEHKIQAEIELPVNQKAPTESYAPVVSNYSTASLAWPDNLVPKEFYIDGDDQLKKIRNKVEKLWFFIVPEGMAQAVILNMVDTNRSEAQISLVLNPFTLQLATYDSFQKP